MTQDGKLEEVSGDTEFRSSSAYSNYVLGILFVVYVFNFVDRQIMSVFIGPIKEEFGVSDTAMGLLVGFAFALLYTVVGIPIARWADSGNRRNIIALGLAVWSAMTVLSGLARSFATLAIARVGVGVGEAAGSPPAHSLIADYFPLNRRATALAVYASGAFVGSGIAYLGGGYLREYFDWRTAFIVVGAPGILLALVLRFTVKEPPRGYSEVGAKDDSTSTLKETLHFLMASRCWVLLMLGFSLVSLTGYAVLMWGYEFFGRVHGMSPIRIGQWMGLIVGVGGSVGTIFGGLLVDKVSVKSLHLGIKVPVWITLLGLPLGAVFLLTTSPTVSLLFFAPFYVLLNIYIPAMYAANQALAKLRMRATASAIMLFVVNIVGAGLGPLVVGILSDYFSPQFGLEAIRYALLVSLGLGVIGCVLLLVSSRYYEDGVLKTRPKKIQGRAAR
ncbi:spinster family MFS transporter [Zhongshania aquimaris]|uniref:MFS transporter n=1 Tax=Zhongshania aquimaris TaxID=2857107 RepID=A0ABS6VW38_9GAMM|nr:MFS transporter [Zhongshania aquimaris]MBW2942496.1 MFS transporter [Zhongshania aquimaris]